MLLMINKLIHMALSVIHVNMKVKKKKERKQCWPKVIKSENTH